VLSANSTNITGLQQRRKAASMKSKIQISSFDVEALRARLRKMSDVELIRFGKDARYMCSPWANMSKPPRADFQVQLDEAKSEWKRRHPENTEHGNMSE
jgi:hypothetical protein